MRLQELRHVVWEQLGKRINPNTPEPDMHSLLNYEFGVEQNNPINKYRDTIMNFIKKHEGRLSLPCNGNCYEHTDGTVLFCYKKLMEDN